MGEMTDEMIGSALGINDATNDGIDAGVDAGLTLGCNDGWDDGTYVSSALATNDGTNDGIDAGVDVGLTLAHNHGWDDGTSVGLALGINDGYKDGTKDGVCVGIDDYHNGYPQKLSKNSGTISSWYEIKRITMCRYFNLMFQANDSWKNFLYTMECENLHFTFSVLIVKELLENLYVEKQFNEPHPRRKSNNKIQSNSRSNFKQT